MNDKDEKMLEAVRAFNPHDLYSKSDDAPSIEELKVRPTTLLCDVCDVY
jgi:inositol oxygenase